MKRILRNIFSVFVLIAISPVLWSCEQDEPDDSPFVDNGSNGEAQSTILIYANATNSLSGNLVSDKNEILVAATKFDVEKNNVLVFQSVYEYDENYQRTGNGLASLIKLVKTTSGYGWETIKEYSYDTAPLNPDRISEVIDYTIKKYPAKNKGLIFWSHSTASDPYFPQTRSEEEGWGLPMAYSFGSDSVIGSGKEYYQINVDDLAAVVPDNVFNFIWFDSCYMGNIETIYQFRNKCDYFIGYPTEVLDDGMPYQYTLPLLVSSEPKIVEAAQRLFVFYNEEYSYHIATIVVVEMNKINVLENFCKNVYEGNKQIPSTSSLHRYTNNRQSSGPFYDLGDYTKAVASLNGKTISSEEWEEVLSECVIYKDATTYDFNNNRINKNNFSGISTYVYRLGDETQKERFYESLDWFQAVYPDGTFRN